MDEFEKHDFTRTISTVLVEDFNRLNYSKFQGTFRHIVTARDRHEKTYAIYMGLMAILQISWLLIPAPAASINLLMVVVILALGVVAGLAKRRIGKSIKSYQAYFDQLQIELEPVLQHIDVRTKTGMSFSKVLYFMVNKKGKHAATTKFHMDIIESRVDFLNRRGEDENITTL